VPSGAPQVNKLRRLTVARFPAIFPMVSSASSSTCPLVSTPGVREAVSGRLSLGAVLSGLLEDISNVLPSRLPRARRGCFFRGLGGMSDGDLLVGRPKGRVAMAGLLVMGTMWIVLALLVGEETLASCRGKTRIVEGDSSDDYFFQERIV
jgi:hypothetical protein